MNSKYKFIFFDFDGTLMDTSEGIYESAFYALKKDGVTVPPNVDLKKFIGPPISYGFRHVFGVTDDEKVDHLMQLFRSYYAEFGAFKAKFYNGFPLVLEDLVKERFLLAVASMKNTELIKVMLKYFKIDRYFSAVFGLNLKGTNTKSDVISEAVSFFKANRSECVMVGDSEYDSEGAQQVGVDCIKVNWGFGFTADDDNTVSNTAELIDKIRYSK